VEVQLRIGIHTGTVMGSVVSLNKPRYLGTYLRNCCLHVYVIRRCPCLLSNPWTCSLDILCRICYLKHSCSNQYLVLSKDSCICHFSTIIQYRNYPNHSCTRVPLRSMGAVHAHSKCDGVRGRTRRSQHILVGATPPCLVSSLLLSWM